MLVKMEHHFPKFRGSSVQKILQKTTTETLHSSWLFRDSCWLKAYFQVLHSLFSGLREYCKPTQPGGGVSQPAPQSHRNSPTPGKPQRRRPPNVPGVFLFVYVYLGFVGWGQTTRYELYIPSLDLQKGAKWFRYRVSIHHPLA